MSVCVPTDGAQAGHPVLRNNQQKRLASVFAMLTPSLNLQARCVQRDYCANAGTSIEATTKAKRMVAGRWPTTSQTHKVLTSVIAFPLTFPQYVISTPPLHSTAGRQLGPCKPIAKSMPRHVWQGHHCCQLQH